MWRGWHLLGMTVMFVWAVVTTWTLVMHFRRKKENDENR